MIEIVATGVAHIVIWSSRHRD